MANGLRHRCEWITLRIVIPEPAFICLEILYEERINLYDHDENKLSWAADEFAKEVTDYQEMLPESYLVAWAM